MIDSLIAPPAMSVPAARPVSDSVGLCFLFASYIPDEALQIGT
jgi:hypothetical protein